MLPPPLVPGPEPLVRITITRVEMPGLPVFGAGWIGVQARHEDRLGEYPILMPMTTEQSLIGGREVNGEPKKLAEVEVHRDGDRVSAHIARMGSVICEITGRISETRENYELAKTDFWFKLSPSCEAAGELDQDPLLVYGEKTERTRLHEGIDGELILKEAPLDPVADLVVRRMVDLNWTERASTQVGRVIGPVPPRRARALHPPALRRPLGARGEAMSERYTIISADAHAGLHCEEYRPYLDARYHRQFDEYLAERHANRDQQLQMNYDYIMGWETDNEEGLRGAWDIEQRDKELDADGVTAEVMFADADAITGMASPPFGAGLSAGAIDDPELAFAGARAHNRFLAEMCARSPERHGGIALVPITHGVERSVAEIEWLVEQPGIRGIMVPTMWHDLVPYNHPDYDPVWAACQEAGFPVHTHSGEAPQEEYNDNIGIYLAEVVWWAARPMWHLLFSGVFERYPRLKYVVTEAAAYWAADMMWKWDQYMGGGHTTKKMAALLKGKISKLPSDYFGENLFIGASTMSPRGDPPPPRARLRRRDVGDRLPAPRGHLAPHPGAPAQRLRRHPRRGRPPAAGRDGGAVLRIRPRRAAADRRARRTDTCGPGPGPVPAHRPRGGADHALVEGRVPAAAARLTAMNEGHMRFCASDEWRSIVHESILPVAFRDVELGDEAIEIGPGPGFTTDILRTRTAHLTAVELDEGLAAALAERLAGGNVDVVVGDATALDFGAGRFTGAASFHMLHHIAPEGAQDRAFAELATRARPGRCAGGGGRRLQRGQRRLPRERHLQPDRPRGAGGTAGRGGLRLRPRAHPRPRVGVHGPGRLSRPTSPLRGRSEASSSAWTPRRR